MPPHVAGVDQSGSMRCPACGAVNSARNVFCLGCARKLEHGPSGHGVRDFLPQLAQALYAAQQSVSTGTRQHAHVAIIAGSILAVARSIQNRVSPSVAVLGEAPLIAMRDGGFAQNDPLVVAFGHVADFCRNHPRDDAALAAAAVDPELSARAQSLADTLRAR